MASAAASSVSLPVSPPVPSSTAPTTLVPSPSASSPSRVSLASRTVSPLLPSATTSWPPSSRVLPSSARRVCSASYLPMLLLCTFSLLLSPPNISLPRASLTPALSPISLSLASSPLSSHPRHRHPPAQGLAPSRWLLHHVRGYVLPLPSTVALLSRPPSLPLLLCPCAHHSLSVVPTFLSLLQTTLVSSATPRVRSRAPPSPAPSPRRPLTSGPTSPPSAAPSSKQLNVVLYPSFHR